MSRACVLAALATSTVLSGCAADDGVLDAGGRTQSCVGETTRPITEAELTGALRRHGFTVFPLPGDAICDLPVAERMPVHVGNIVFNGPDANIEQHDEIAEREATVYCGLRRGPIWGWTLDADLDAPAASPIFSGDKATFAFANLECTIYPRGEHGGARVLALQDTLRELVALARKKRR
jgi:hypothetical protein